MEIRHLTIGELPLCLPYGEQFHSELKLPGKFVDSTFMTTWMTFYTQCQATVIGLWKDGQLVGGLGALLSPDLNDGRLCGTEIFMFIDPAHRTGSGLLRLFRAYKSWVLEKGGEELRITHFLTEPERDEHFDRLYRSLGCRPLERTYVCNLKES